MSKVIDRTISSVLTHVSLKRRLLALVGVVVLFPLLIIWLGVSQFVSSAEQDAWRGRQGEAARNAAGTVAAYIVRIEDTLTLASTLEPGYLQEKPGVLSDLLKQNPALLEIVRLDANGHVLASANHDAPVLANLFTTPLSNWFRKAAAGQQYISSLQQSSLVGPYLVMAQPAPDGSVVASRLQMNVLWNVVSVIHFGTTGTAYIIDRNGQILAHTERNVVLENTTVAGRPELLSVLATSNREWAGTYVNFEGTRVVGATAAVPGTDWVVITELAPAEAFRISHNAFLYLGTLMVLFGCLILWATARLLERQVFQPIEQLRTGAERIGQGDLKHQIPLIRHDEIGQVTASFNLMGSRLQDREQQVAAKTAALEAEVAERKRAEDALRESEERYALATRGANDGLWDWRPKSNEIYYSPRWKAMLGYTDKEIGADWAEWLGRVHPEDVDQLKVALSAHLTGLTEHFQHEHRILHKDGSYRWMLSRGQALWDADGVAYRMAGSQTDITERKHSEEQMVRNAFYDRLTDLPNRALFLDRLGRAIERARRHQGRAFAILFLDFDNFKVINDSLGHMIGDQLLVAGARRLEHCVRSTDTVARLGGDEFVILLDDSANTEDARLVAARIQAELSLPFHLGEHEVAISTSIGIVLSQQDYNQAEEILRDADIAMYHAKALGKARSEVFDPSLRFSVLARLGLETDLRRGIERQELRLYYQPIVDLRTGRIAGFEALVRWHHPRRGLVAPADFLPIAEETGLIVPIGNWVLHEACRQLRVWHAQFPMDPPLTMSVNLSSREMAQPNLAETIMRALQETGLEGSHLRLEVTERTIIHNVQAASAMLLKLKALGVEVQMDDFGTGHSALSYLQDLPVDAIKIDRSFISRMDGGNGSGLVQTIAAFAHTQGMEVIAEGIETEDALATLRRLGCEYGQGFLFSKPVDSGALRAMLTESTRVSPAIDLHGGRQPAGYLT